MGDFVKAVASLGETISRRLRKAGGGLSPLSSLAAEALREHRSGLRFNMEAFLRSFWKVKKLPKQLSPHGGFGQPPITLYRDKQFLIDIYFWVTPQISIHSHAFRGAFAVLQGKSLHCEYTFQVKKDFGDQVQLGDLNLKATHLLREGDVEEILPGPDFIHQVWHISFPTVSLAVRTRESIPQYTYFKPHLAIPAFLPVLDAVTMKKMMTLFMLHRIGHPLQDDHLRTLIAKAVPARAILCLLSYFQSTQDLDRLRKVMQKTPALAEWAPYLLSSFARMQETRTNWDRLEAEGDRLLTALLHSVTDRREMERLVRGYAPAEPPAEWILTRLKKLIHNKTLGFEFNDTAWEIFERLYQGETEASICGRISKKYAVGKGASLQKEIRDCRAKLTSLPLLKPMLA
ncbi:MAG: hypothetical protein HY466_01695 [Deltaproteobacteria bacterium]|nr:hypothetical protein [Deltaproteobacteria bacterium]